jgi:2-amino-4-hydroxy-6-hydroxymethyldihydropteridine diphosphokinase
MTDRGEGSSAFVGLGSNLADPVAQLQRALDALAAIHSTRLVARSSLYRSAPWGRSDQPEFVNAVAKLQTWLDPRALLDALLAIEAAAGRIRAERWGPRILDLDLLLYGDRVIDEPGLHVPHPRLVERAFVLLPLAELAPDLVIAGVGSVAALRARIDADGVEVIDGECRGPEI